MGAYGNTSEASKTYSFGIGENRTSFQSKFNIYSPYPNPFNPTTTIIFDLPIEAEVSFSVFDIYSAHVGGTRHASSFMYNVYPPGTHSITFDGTNLSSGIYFYQLHAGELTATGKMVILK